MSSFKDVVVLLPGITGSVLADRRGKEIWSPSARAIWRAVTSGGGSIDALALASDDIDDGVSATKLVPDVTIIPRLVKIDGYSQTTKYLIDGLGLVDGQNFHAFPYDWRRSCARVARQFESQAMAWLKHWQESSGHTDAKLILIGHSLGGLVSRYFLECLGGWQHTRFLFTLGTPHRGSLNAVDFFVHGMKKGVGPLGLDLTPLLRSFTSVYQLLPTYPCIDIETNEQVRVHEAARKGLLPGIDPSRAIDAWQGFHREIEAQQERNAKEEAYGRGYSLIPIVGIEQLTYQSAKCENGRVEMLRRWNGEDQRGDGTVPTGSATPIELESSSREVYAADTHGSLQNAASVLAGIRGVLTRGKIDFRRMRDTTAAALSLDVDDVTLPGEPLRIRAMPLERSPKVTVRLTSLTDGQAIEDTLQRGEAGWQVGEFIVSPGIWRVTANASGCSPVADLATVAE